MAHPFVRAALVASIVAGVSLAGASPAAAGEGEPEIEYAYCLHNTVQLPDGNPPFTVTVCSPVWPF